MKSLKEKITDKNDMPYVQLDKSFANHQGCSVPPPWWLKREWARIEANIYPQATTVIEQLNNAVPQFALHIAEEEPTMVAYTPDAAYGCADRQVRTSLARFVTKYYPHLSDETIRDMQADHLAELDTSFEVLTGQALVDVYKSGAVSACMSKKDIVFLGRRNPTEVYDAPNISMAVLRDKDGAISARCMLYTPTPEDKRYIRNYGDGKLLSKLKRCDYKTGTWHGCTFRTIPIPDKPNTYLMPYLDGMGTLGSTEYSAVALIDGVIRSITSEVYHKLYNINYRSVAYCTSTAGTVYLENISSEAFTGVCCITKRSIDLLTETVYSFWHEGKLQTICREALDPMLMKECRYTVSGKIAYTYNSTPTFTNRGYNYLDTSEMREHFGWKRLSAKYYPEEQDWVNTNSNHRQLPDGSWIKDIESVFVAHKDGEHVHWVNVHESEIGKGYTKLHAKERGKLYYAESDVEVVKTIAGRKVVKALYDVRVLCDGTVDFERNLRNVTVLGESVWYRRGESRPDISSTSEIFKGILREQLEFEGKWDRNAKDLVTNHISMHIQIDGKYLYRIVRPIPWAELWAIPSVKEASIGIAINEMMQERPVVNETVQEIAECLAA